MSYYSEYDFDVEQYNDYNSEEEEEEEEKYFFEKPFRNNTHIISDHIINKNNFINTFLSLIDTNLIIEIKDNNIELSSVFNDDDNNKNIYILNIKNLDSLILNKYDKISLIKYIRSNLIYLIKEILIKYDDAIIDFNYFHYSNMHKDDTIIKYSATLQNKYNILLDI